jgi:signal transduction histidine kinase
MKAKVSLLALLVITGAGGLASPLQSRVEKPVLLIRMPAEPPLAKAPTYPEVVEFLARRSDSLEMMPPDILQSANLARDVLGQHQIFDELARFQAEHQIPARVKFVARSEALRYFIDYVSDGSNPPVVAQLSDTWLAYFRSLGVVPFEQRYSSDVRVLWYWKDLVTLDDITDGERFVNVCHRLLKSPSAGLIAPLAIPTAPAGELLDDLSVWLYNAGLPQLISSDSKWGLLPWTEAKLAGPEAQQAIRYLSSLVRQGYVALPEQPSTEVAEDFLARKYAMVILGASMMPRAERRLGARWQWHIQPALPPRIGEREATTIKIGTSLVVLDPTRGQDQATVERARRLVEFLSSTQSQERCAHTFGELPADPEALKQTPYLSLFQMALQAGRTYPEIPEWALVVENVATRDNLFAFWKRLSALAEPHAVSDRSEQIVRERLILGALHSAESYLNGELSPGKAALLWPRLALVGVPLLLMTLLVLWRRRVERTRADAELRRKQDELAHVARVVTVGELTAALAHELNQPLAAIVSNAQATQRLLASDKPDLREVSEAVSDIAEDGKRAGEIIRRLRAFLRKNEAEQTRLNINEVVQEVVALLRGSALKELAIRCELAERLPPVSGDRVQLQQVILNLLVNASEATSGGDDDPREVVIRTSSNGSEMIEVSVQDFGGGLDETHKQDIFEPFFTTKPRGLGMGLPISRSIIEAHGGRLWATPNPQRGATFHFTLRRHQDGGHEGR